MIKQRVLRMYDADEPTVENGTDEIAQRVEHSGFNRSVAGSSPAFVSKRNNISRLHAVFLDFD